MREFKEEYELTLLILSMVSKERRYSSLSGLPNVLLALLLVLRLPGENAAGPPKNTYTKKRSIFHLIMRLRDVKWKLTHPPR